MFLYLRSIGLFVLDQFIHIDVGILRFDEVVGVSETKPFDISFKGHHLLVVDRLPKGVMFLPHILLTSVLEQFVQVVRALLGRKDIVQSLHEEDLHLTQTQIGRQ